MLSNLIKRRLFYGAFFSILTLVFLYLANGLYFINQGDFDRISGYFFQQSIDENSRVWILKTSFKNVNFDIAAWVFGLYAAMQRVFGTEYHLAFSALMGQILMMFYAHLISKKIADTLNFGSLRRLAFLTILSLTFFYSHNVAMLNSLYGEYVFMLALPLLILGFLYSRGSPTSRLGPLFLVLGSFLIGMAKTQYFYVPILVILVLIITNILENKKNNYLLIMALMVTQAGCFLPLKNNSYTQINYYHSLYFGSYLLFDKKQLSALGVSQNNLDCIGVDAWGNKASGIGGLTVESGNKTCYGNEKINLLKVLRPYWVFPSSLFNMIIYSAPHLTTIKYFHVYPNNYYVKSVDSAVGGNNRILVGASEIRDSIVSKMIPLFLLIGLAGIFFSEAKTMGIAQLSFFLTLFFISQFLVSILGEGIRDIGKHMWAAQFSLDMMIALWFIPISSYSVRYLHNRKYA